MYDLVDGFWLSFLVCVPVFCLMIGGLGRLMIIDGLGRLGSRLFVCMGPMLVLVGGFRSFQTALPSIPLFAMPNRCLCIGGMIVTSLFIVWLRLSSNCLASGDCVIVSISSLLLSLSVDVTAPVFAYKTVFGAASCMSMPLE